MSREYEYLTVRFLYETPLPKSDEELEGILDNLKTPIMALYKTYGDIGEAIVITIKRGERRNTLTITVKTSVPVDAETLAENIRRRIAPAVDGTYTMFPDRIEIVYQMKSSGRGGKP